MRYDGALTSWLPQLGFVEIVALSDPSQAAPPPPPNESVVCTCVSSLLQVWELRSPLGIRLYGQSSVPDQQESCELGILGRSQQGRHSFLLSSPIRAQPCLLRLPGKAQKKCFTCLP